MFSWFTSADAEVVEAGIEVSASAIAQTSKVSESRTALRASSALGFKALKKITGLGAFVTAVFVAKEVGGHLWKGNYGLATGSFVAGAAETVGAAVGFGIGDLARGVTRQGLIAIHPAQAEVDRADLRILYSAAHAAIVGENGNNAVALVEPAVPEMPAALKTPAVAIDPLGSNFAAVAHLKPVERSAIASNFGVAVSGTNPIIAQPAGLEAPAVATASVINPVLPLKV